MRGNWLNNWRQTEWHLTGKIFKARSLHRHKQQLFQFSLSFPLVLSWECIKKSTGHFTDHWENNSQASFYSGTADAQYNSVSSSHDMRRNINAISVCAEQTLFFTHKKLTSEFSQNKQNNILRFPLNVFGDGFCYTPAYFRLYLCLNCLKPLLERLMFLRFRYKIWCGRQRSVFVDLST